MFVFKMFYVVFKSREKNVCILVKEIYDHNTRHAHTLNVLMVSKLHPLQTLSTWSVPNETIISTSSFKKTHTNSSWRILRNNVQQVYLSKHEVVVEYRNIWLKCTCCWRKEGESELRSEGGIKANHSRFPIVFVRNPYYALESHEWRPVFDYTAFSWMLRQTQGFHDEWRCKESRKGKRQFSDSRAQNDSDEWCLHDLLDGETFHIFSLFVIMSKDIDEKSKSAWKTIEQNIPLNQQRSVIGDQGWLRLKATSISRDTSSINATSFRHSAVIAMIEKNLHLRETSERETLVREQKLWLLVLYLKVPQ